MNSPTVLNWYFLLAEEARTATFSRINMQGCIVGNTMNMPQFPYQLRASIVFLLSDVRAFRGEKVKLRMTFPNASGDSFASVDDEVQSIPERNVPDDSPAPLVLIVPLSMWFFAGGTISIDVQLGDSVFSKSWSAVAGDGPFSGTRSPRGGAAILGATTTAFDLPALIAGASKELLIVDPYLFPADLAAVLAHVPPTSSIRVLIPPKHASAYKSAFVALNVSHGALQIRVAARSHARSLAADTGPFHDRFVCVNGHELYWFGTSLRSVTSDRVSRVAKIFDAEEHASILKIVDDEWNNAVAL